MKRTPLSKQQSTPTLGRGKSNMLCFTSSFQSCLKNSAVSCQFVTSSFENNSAQDECVVTLDQITKINVYKRDM